MKTVRLSFPLAFGCILFGSVFYLPEGMFLEGAPLVFLMLPLQEDQKGKRKGRK